MKNKICILIIIIIVFIFIITINNPKQENGNMSNMGLAIEYKGAVYYNKYEKGIFCYKKHQEQQLTDETAYSINIIDDKIYYLTVADFDQIIIKRVDINGKNLQNIANIDTSISKIYVDKKYIYYINNKNGIVRINLNGENEEIILPENVQDFEVKKKEIFYVNYDNQICKISIDGEDSQILNEISNTKKIQIVNKWIYYYNQNENALFRITKDGKKTELISTLVNDDIYNVNDKYVYYFDKENSKIARMKIGKSNKCNDIINLNASRTKINIAGGEIYYLDKSQNESQTYQIYRVKINGKETEEINYE